MAPQALHGPAPTSHQGRSGLPKWIPYALAVTAVVIIGLIGALIFVLVRTPTASTPVAAPTTPSSSVSASSATSSSTAASSTSTPSQTVTVPTVPATGGALVKDAVDIYDVPDGVGNIIGVLHPGRRVDLVEPCRDGWCHVVLPEMPGGTGWVWGEFLAF
jgi:hypothetical protein